MAKIPDFFGVEISTNRINICKLSDSKDKVELLLSESLSTNIHESQTDELMRSASQELAKLYKKSKIKTKYCVTSVPDKLIFSRLLTLPDLKDEELDEAIHWAVKPLIPVPIEQVNISYLGINKTLKDGKQSINWYIVAAPIKLIEQYQKLFKAADLDLLAIESEALALTRMQFINYSIKNDVLIVDIQHDKTNLVLARNKSVVFSQVLEVGAGNMIKAIASDYGINEEQATQYMYQFGLDPNQGEGKILKSLQPVFDIVKTEISRTISYYKDKLGGGTIDNIYISGQGSVIPGIEEFLSGQTGMTSIISTPFQNLKFSNKVKEQLENTNLGYYSVATGLALKGK